VSDPRNGFPGQSKQDGIMCDDEAVSSVIERGIERREGEDDSAINIIFPSRNGGSYEAEGEEDCAVSCPHSSHPWCSCIVRERSAPSAVAKDIKAAENASANSLSSLENASR